MNTRRPASAAGTSWSKWEDPLVYGRYPSRAERWRGPVLFWLTCIDLGLFFGLLAIAGVLP